MYVCVCMYVCVWIYQWVGMCEYTTGAKWVGMCEYTTGRAVYRNFAEGGRIWGMDKRGGAQPGGSSIVSCEVLHSRGGENDTRGGECPSPPPLKYGPDWC